MLSQLNVIEIAVPVIRSFNRVRDALSKNPGLHTSALEPYP
jgi:hypothetical protein